jgi:hypothetical protein
MPVRSTIPTEENAMNTLKVPLILTIALLPGLARAGVTAAPPTRLTGVADALSVSDGRLTGAHYDVQVGTDSARGAGPRGPIDVRLTSIEGGYEVAGLWNGGRVHLTVTTAAIRGGAIRPHASGEWSFCRYSLRPSPDASSFAGTAQCGGPYPPYRIELHPRTPAALVAPSGVVLLVAHLTATLTP